MTHRANKRYLKEKFGHYTVYDIETEQMSETRLKAKSWQEKRKHSPKPRVMVVYSSKSDEYHSFYPEQMATGVRLLLNSDTIVSYNGRDFDENVLIRHGFMDKSFEGLGKRSFDLLKRLTKKHGYRAKLNGLARLNLGEKKHTSGRKMSEIDGEKLVEACKSDVRQTRILFEMWAHNPNNIRYPNKRQRRYIYAGLLDERDGIGQNITTECFECGSEFGEVMEEDMEENSEGQFADYLAGNWGMWGCWDCGEVSFRDS